MWRSFNMGVGMVAVVAKDDLADVLEHLRQAGVPASPWVA
jgi:phosphoribosylaminoimidazole (AIR) synthetase